MAARKGPFRLVTVNTAPERAQRLIGRLVEALKEEYEIVHVDNCQSKLLLWNTKSIKANETSGIDEVLPKVTLHQPDVLVSPHKS